MPTASNSGTVGTMVRSFPTHTTPTASFPPATLHIPLFWKLSRHHPNFTSHIHSNAPSAPQATLERDVYASRVPTGWIIREIRSCWCPKLALRLPDHDLDP
ncbi:hypothetical protein FA13DRAFT_1736305 [Coprinellus micaceus]|uniref:Uncharacterized protein n=1 Tax=Coprinellus micaceus TaxID=71717 RepID=A0A4Y7T1E6_COPMI|nr:hypothetical protein FA13DRAFT_1736305 [Coprinellus micaceus]